MQTDWQTDGQTYIQCVHSWMIIIQCLWILVCLTLFTSLLSLLSLYSRPSNFIHFSHLCRHPAVHGRICEKRSCLCCGSTGAHRCTGDVETKDAVVTECWIFLVTSTWSSRSFAGGVEWCWEIVWMESIAPQNCEKSTLYKYIYIYWITCQFHQVIH